ncbi:MAG: hypothetical protein JO273_06150 [Methylobacteriaceae bacterium]|nr:hypothetical protein [Methylobacteriaceae bacterium]
MRLTDPFPIAGRGLEATHAIDWEAMARQIVHEVLRTERGERVILSADPYYGGAMLDAMRFEFQKAGAIELATILHWTPRLTTIRSPEGCKTDERDARAEDAAMRDLFAIADIFVWLQNDWRSKRSTHAIGQTERVLDRWHGRGVHFHWFHDPLNADPDLPPNKELDLVYQDAVLKLDYSALRSTMHGLVERMAETELNIHGSGGTDLRLRTSARFHVNDGDASKEKASRAASARDREEEIPCGALRTVPQLDSVEGVIGLSGGFGFPVPGYGLDVDRFIDGGLRFVFERGRIVRIETKGDQVGLDAAWAAETGDRDRLGELVLGCNPLLRPVSGTRFPPYYGFGDGVLRLTIGENIESGGTNRASTHRWLYLFDATIEAAGRTLVRNGRIVP